MKLQNRTTQTDIVKEVDVASTFWQRSRGLLGQPSWPHDKTLWIQGSPWMGCNSIHTLFMQFPIDAVFVDRNLVVTKIYHNLQPWRMTWPAPRAHSVFEFAAGTLAHSPIQIGDQLHVGD